MNTKILEYIIAAAQEGSITKAAERFYLSQPVLSRHIKTAEEEMGAALFERKHQGLVLTDAGKIYINSAKQILHLEACLEAELADMASKKTENISR